MWCLVGSSFANRSVLWKHSPLSSKVTKKKNKNKHGSNTKNQNENASASSSTEGSGIDGSTEDSGAEVVGASVVDTKNDDVEQLPAPAAVSTAVSVATPRGNVDV